MEGWKSNATHMGSIRLTAHNGSKTVTLTMSQRASAVAKRGVSDVDQWFPTVWNGSVAVTH